MPGSLIGLGGGMIINGLFNALVNSINSRKSLAANAKEQEKNRQFQEALQQKQWKHAENLQREMREMTRRNFLEQIEHQQKMADFQALENRWPLPASSPRLIINEFNEYLKEGKAIPLQLIVVENGDLSKPLSIRLQVRNAINELNKFMSTHYGMNTEYAVKVHDTSKSGSNFGASEVHTVFHVFKVAPTMILTSRVHDSAYVLECWFWGGSMMEDPRMVEIYRCDVQELQLSVLKEIANKWPKDKLKLGVDDPDKDALVDLMKRMENEENRLKQRGATPEDLNNYARKKFVQEIHTFTSISKLGNKTINAEPFVRKINESIERNIFSSFKISASLLSDAHFLLEYKAPPKFMQVCSKEMDEFPELRQQAESFFEQAVEALPFNHSDKALLHARMATAYHNANYTDKAITYGTKSVRLLEEMVSPENFVYEANEDMHLCLKELNLIESIKKKAPWINNQAQRQVSPDDLNKRAAELYGQDKVQNAISIWKKAVALGHRKSIRNLAYVLKSINRTDEANELFAKAICDGEKDLFKEGHDVALWYCKKGMWAKAFCMWLAYLQSGDTEFRHIAEAYSAIILFTDTYNDISRGCNTSEWVKAVGGDLTCSIQNVAEDLLTSTVESSRFSDDKLKAFYNVLSVWYLKSRGENIPLIYGLNDDTELLYALPATLASEYEKWFKQCLTKAGRPDIQPR